MSKKQQFQISEKIFGTIFEQSPISTQIFSPTGETIKVNKAWVKLWRTKPTSIVHHYNILNDTQLVEKGVMPFIQKAFRGDIVDIPAIKYEPSKTIPHISKTTYKWVKAVMYPIKDHLGRITEVVLQHVDITESKLAEERQGFFDTLNITLAHSLDEHITLSEIAKLIVPYMADYCRIAVVDDAKYIKEIAINHKNPKKVDLTKDLYDTYIDSPESTHGVKHILQTGKPEMIRSVDEKVLEKIKDNQYLVHIVKKIGLKSYIGVPLIARRKIIGAITCSSTKKYGYYTHNDLLFAQEIARRIALTLDNQRLYKEATEEISYRKKIEAILQDREQRIRTIWESASDAIVVSDKKGIVIDANPAYLKLYEYSPADILHKNFAVIFSKEKRQKANKQYKELFTSEKIIPSFESEILTSTGEKRIVESRYGFVMNDGKREAMVSIIRDVTTRKELEERKNEFISAASHELKTPVTSIKVYAQVLQKRFLEKGDTQSAEHLAKMDAQLTKLTNLIIDLLDISKIESGKLQFTSTKFSFDELVQEVIEEMQRITTRHTIVMSGNTHKKIFADKERTGQVIVNYLSNAIKYSPESDKIIVHVSSSKKHVALCVEDFGVGIPKEKQEKVFERFYRISGPKEDTFPGLGLGLYISAEIIKRQGGKIWVESPTFVEKTSTSAKATADTSVGKKEGKGSRFCFSLPIKSVV